MNSLKITDYQDLKKSSSPKISLIEYKTSVRTRTGDLLPFTANVLATPPQKLVE